MVILSQKLLISMKKKDFTPDLTRACDIRVSPYDKFSINICEAVTFKGPHTISVNEKARVKRATDNSIRILSRSIANQSWHLDMLAHVTGNVGTYK